MPVIAAQNDSFEKVQSKLLSMLEYYYGNDLLWQKPEYRAFNQKNREAMRRKPHVSGTLSKQSKSLSVTLDVSLVYNKAKIKNLK